MNLREKTYQLLHERPRTLTFAEIERKTELKQSWVRSFSQGKITGASADKVQKLYEFLSGKKLKV